MNAEYLLDLLNKAKELKDRDLAASNDLQIKTGEALKVLFPADTAAYTVQNLHFSPIFYPSNYESEISQYRESKNTLISIIEAKLDILKYKQTKAFLGNPQPKEAPIEVYKKTVSELHAEVKRLELKNIKQGKDYETNKLDLLKKLQEYKTIAEDNTKFEEELKSAKRSRLLKDLAIIGPVVAAAFTLGFYFGNAKFDNDKINMSDKIREQKHTIDSLKKDRADSLKQKIKPNRGIKNI